MKNYVKWLLGFTAFILLLLGATLAYTKLSLNYEKEKQSEAQETSQPAQQQEAAQNEPTDEDTKVIDFTMLNADGETIAFSELLGKPVILNFWATWCGPCQSEMPHIQEAYEQYGEDINFVLVNLTDGKRDTIDGVKSFIEENGYTVPVYFDTEMKGAYSYGAYSIPLTYFMDAQGAVVSGRLGAMTREDLFDQIQVLINQ